MEPRELFDAHEGNLTALEIGLWALIDSHPDPVRLLQCLQMRVAQATPQVGVKSDALRLRFEFMANRLEDHVTAVLRLHGGRS